MLTRFCGYAKAGFKRTLPANRTKLTKVHKLSATTKTLLLHRCCYKPFLFRFFMLGYGFKRGKWYNFQGIVIIFIMIGVFIYIATK